MNTLPKDYVVLGHIKDINVPQDWGHYGTPKTYLTFAFFYKNERWIVEGKSGWLHKTDDENILVAALPNSPLYNMNLPKKTARVRPTVKQVKELENKILSLEVTNTLLETEVKQLREQLAAISKIIKG